MSWTEKELRDLRDIRDALDAMEDKRLIRGKYFCKKTNLCCSIDELGRSKVVNIEGAFDFERSLSVSSKLLNTVVSENDKYKPNETLEERWQRMRRWVNEQLQEVV